jgi:myo-inositol-1(or 4)-monophosphatase
MESSFSELTLTAINAALQAGELLKKGFGTHFKIESKPGRQNLVTEYDKTAEQFIISSIQKRFADHSILAEESGALTHSKSPYTWIIDPLDGTVNFAHGIPHFSVSIAVAKEEKVISGAVFQPMTQELFVAERGQGAFLNGTALSVSSDTSLDTALLATGFPYNADENPLHCIDHFALLQGQGIPIRRLGSAAIDLAYVAAGRFAAFWEVTLQPWDMAAGMLLVEEAGGRVTHYDGKKRSLFNDGTVLATNGHLHQQMIAQLNPHAEWRGKV